SINNDTLRAWNGQNYIKGITPGRKSNRIGRIVSIDYENDAAVAKIEILMPGPKRIYTDYMMLLKVGGRWKIIHKSFTFVNYPKP
ncbi:MAG: nuclear transport factor 2 family protein, partial [Bacteroidota bacterium]